jgi:hypothetical protein
VVSFLARALADALLGRLTLAARVAAIDRLPELRNGRRTRQIDAFVARPQHRLAERLGLVVKSASARAGNG